jgi:hypothetical protein
MSIMEERLTLTENRVSQLIGAQKMNIPAVSIMNDTTAAQEDSSN